MVQNKQNWAKSLTSAINLASSAGFAIAIGLLGGRWLDTKFNTGNSLYTIIGAILGAVTAMKMLWENMMKDSRKNTSQGDQDNKDKVDGQSK